jgi:hypothetical protein
LLKALDAYALDYGFKPNFRGGGKVTAKKSVTIRYGRVCK